jgi:hypothetical protein
VAEQLALEQRLRQRGAVEREQRPGPSRQRVQGVGEQLLADAGLAGDQHVDRAGGDVADQTVHAAPGRIVDAQRLGDAAGRGRAITAAVADHDERERADREALAGRHRHRVATAHDLACDPRPVGRSEILDRHRRAEPERGMAPRQRRVSDHHVAGGVAPDHDRVAPEGVGRQLTVADHQERRRLARRRGRRSVELGGGKRCPGGHAAP